ncbi:MAG: hypothetical protein Q7K42_04685 [Candidatus Diapherotrites archaeon]|nr:hypothetical protein [Candidatus Diapherotrites archaeon]
MDIKLSKTNFTKGETIEGEIQLKINKPIKAKAVRIRLLGTRNATNSSGKNYVKTVADIPVEVSGEKEYLPSSESLTFPFKLQIPDFTANAIVSGTFQQYQNFNLDNEQTNTAKEIALGITETLQTTGNMLNPITWTLKGSLDIPMGFDVSKDIRITIK